MSEQEPVEEPVEEPLVVKLPLMPEAVGDKLIVLAQELGVGEEKALGIIVRARIAARSNSAALVLNGTDLRPYLPVAEWLEQQITQNPLSAEAVKRQIRELSMVTEDLIAALNSGVHGLAKARALDEALAAPVIHELESYSRGSSDVHLALEFARLLHVECPDAFRRLDGVPNVMVLADPEELDVTGGGSGPLSALPELKGMHARLVEETSAAQEFLAAFVENDAGAKDWLRKRYVGDLKEVAGVWGALMRACAMVRALASREGKGSDH